MRRLTRVDRRWLTLLGLLPFIWYGRPIFTDMAYYLGDLTAQYYAWWSFGHDALQSGSFPLWNPFSMGGMPYHVNPENSLFYPLKLPLIFLSFHKAAALLRAFNGAVAAVGMYCLVRSLGARSLPSVVGSLMFTYGSFMAYKFVHIPYINTAVWFPFQLLLLNLIIARPRRSTALWLAVITATSFLGGSPGVFIVCQLTLLCFAVFEFARRLASGRTEQLRRTLGLLWRAAALVVGMTAVLLVPAFRFISLTPRAEGLANGSNLTDFVLDPEGLLTLIFPYAHYAQGAPYPPVYSIPFLNVPYVGLGAVLLVLFNLGSRRYFKLLPPFAALSSFGVLMAMGTRTALLPWMARHLPIFDWFRWPHDYLLIVYLLLPILAATGLDRFLRARRNTRERLLLLGTAYLLVGMFVLRDSFALAALLILGSLATIAWVLPRVVRLPRQFSPVAAALLLVLLAVDLAYFSSSYRLYLPQAQVRNAVMDPAIEYVAERAGFERVAVAAPGFGTHFRGQERNFGRPVPLLSTLPAGLERATDLERWLKRRPRRSGQDYMWTRKASFPGVDDFMRGFPVNASMIARYQEVSGYDPFAIARLKKLYASIPQERLWDLADVRYVVTAHRLLRDDLEPRFSSDRMHVYENRDRYPRVAIPATIRSGLAPVEVLAWMRREDFSPENELLLEVATSLPGGTGGTARIVEYEANRVVVEAQLQQPGFLLLNDAYHPDWVAHLGDRELPILRADYAFRAVCLPAGRHRVEFVYRPVSFYISAWVSGLCWLGALRGIVLSRRRRGHG